MKPGDKIPIVLEVVRAVVDGEPYVDVNGNPTGLSNKRGNLWWACPVGAKQPLIVVCDDMETVESVQRRNSIVELIELGT